MGTAYKIAQWLKPNEIEAACLQTYYPDPIGTRRSLPPDHQACGRCPLAVALGIQGLVGPTEVSARLFQLGRTQSTNTAFEAADRFMRDWDGGSIGDMREALGG